MRQNFTGNIGSMDFSFLKCHQPMQEDNYPPKRAIYLQRHTYQSLKTLAGNRNCKLVSIFPGGRWCHFNMKMRLITKEHFKVVSRKQCFLGASSCSGIKNKPRAPPSSSLLCGFWHLWLTGTKGRRGAVPGVRIQHSDNWALSLVAGSSYLHTEKVGPVDFKSSLNLYGLSSSPGCIPKVGPSGLDFLCFDPSVSIGPFPENVSPEVWEFLGGMAAPLGLTSPLKPIEDHPDSWESWSSMSSSPWICGYHWHAFILHTHA